MQGIINNLPREPSCGQFSRWSSPNYKSQCQTRRVWKKLKWTAWLTTPRAVLEGMDVSIGSPSSTPDLVEESRCFRQSMQGSHAFRLFCGQPSGGKIPKSLLTLFDDLAGSRWAHIWWACQAAFDRNDFQRRADRAETFVQFGELTWGATLWSEPR